MPSWCSSHFSREMIRHTEVLAAHTNLNQMIQSAWSTEAGPQNNVRWMDVFRDTDRKRGYALESRGYA